VRARVRERVRERVRVRARVRVTARGAPERPCVPQLDVGLWLVKLVGVAARLIVVNSEVVSLPIVRVTGSDVGVGGSTSPNTRVVVNVVCGHVMVWVTSCVTAGIVLRVPSLLTGENFGSKEST